MEYELKDLGGEEKPLDHSEKPPRCGGAGDVAARDARPLYKPDPLASGDSGALKLPSETIQELEKKYAAFVRRDVYGTMGRGELPLEEKVLIAFALATLVPIRLVIGLAMLIFYYVVCRVCTLFKDPNREDEQEDYAHMVGWRREVVVRLGKFLSRVMLCIMGFYWIPETCLENTPREHSDKHDRPGAIVSNHVSYLDILYHMSSSFPSFVAKRSLAKLPLVGVIGKCLGCIYVQRESKSSECKGVSGAIVERVSEAHQSNLSPMMMLFPEGTTTNGEFLLPFKTGAFLAKAPVLPVILRYPYQRFSPAWDSISGVRHVILLLCQFVNHMEVIRLPVYHPSHQEMEDPKLYANNVRKLMATEGDLTLSDIGLTEKRMYLAALNGNGLVLYIRKMTEFFLASSKIFLTSKLLVSWNFFSSVAHFPPDKKMVVSCNVLSLSSTSNIYTCF